MAIERIEQLGPELQSGAFVYGEILLEGDILAAPPETTICDTVGAAVPSVYGAGCWIYCLFRYRLVVVATCTTE